MTFSPSIASPSVGESARDWRTLPLAVIGAGAAGSALTRAWRDAGGTVSAISSRSGEHAGALAAAVGAHKVADTATAAAMAKIVVLAVPDAAIADVAGAIPWRPGQIAVHLAGALGPEALAAAEQRGAAAVAFHPLCAFAHAGEPRLPAGTRFGYSGPATLEPLFSATARDLGGELLPVPAASRTLYHAAAVLASNDLVALAASAVAVLERAGVAHEQALPALLPLLQSALDNLATVGLPAALTGPLVRGDLVTVRRHQQALDGAAERAVYDALAAAAARVALQRDDTPAVARAALSKLAEEGG